MNNEDIEQTDNAGQAAESSSTSDFTDLILQIDPETLPTYHTKELAEYYKHIADWLPDNYPAQARAVTLQYNRSHGRQYSQILHR